MSAVSPFHATGLNRYDAMCRAIAECHSSDEAGQIRNQARALEVLAKQARNIEAERQCAEIRIRAERKWGQMYRQAEKAARGPDHEGKGSQRSCDSTAETLEKLGVTKDQSSQWQKLADASDKQFETALNKASSVTVPTTAGVLRNLGQTVPHDEPPSDPKIAAALWVWGRVNAFIEQIDAITAKQCAQRCDLVMSEDLREQLPVLIDWLKELRSEL